MATEQTSPRGAPMTVADLIALTKRELDADAQRQAQQSAASGAELPRESQTGVTLDLSHRNIHALPVEIIGLIKDRVERLALSHNSQIAVPTQIIQCSRLRYLNIRWNHLKYFPAAVLQLSSLEILDVSKNKIIAIPEGIKNMTSLKFLAVAKNRITRLPLALGEMPTLSKLKFDENPIEFPPAEVLQPVKDKPASSADPEKEKDMCQVVKRYLRQAATREKLKMESEGEISESGVETPRPSKRTIGGRFPVRPSVSGIENITDLRQDTPQEGPPPIPLRSHARGASSQNVPSVRRPGVAPITIDVPGSRSHSETVSSASTRSRRQGYVPRKPNDLGPVDEVVTQGSRSSTASTIKPSHSRNASLASANGFLGVSSGGETSSGAVSPIDGPNGRPGFGTRRLSSLPEARMASQNTSDIIRAVKRLLLILNQIHPTIAQVAHVIKEGTPKRSTLERQLFTANSHVLELDRLVQRFETGSEEGRKYDERTMNTIVLTAIGALKGYSFVKRELKKRIKQIVLLADSIYVRCLMLQVYSSMIEARNICVILQIRIKSPSAAKTPSGSYAWSGRTVTPTQLKPPANRRLRGATILQNASNTSNTRAMPPPVSLSTNGSRSNTMTSLSAATPRSGESFSINPPLSAMPSRSNTMRSVMDDGDSLEQFDNIFLKLRNISELANNCLPRCRTEFLTRQAQAQNSGRRREADSWMYSVRKCEEASAAVQALQNRLAVVKLKDPGVRYQRDFWQLCDALVYAWFNLGTDLKSLAQQGVDVDNARLVMKQTNKAVKEVSKMISSSPLYHHALRGTGPTPMFGGQNLAPPSSTPMITSFSPAGYMLPVPATPMSASLGPAVQATVASTPSTLNPPNEHFAQPRSAAFHERVDTVMQPGGQGRRY